MDLYIYDTKACISSPNNEVCTEIQEIIVDSDGIVKTKNEEIDYFNMGLYPNPAGDYFVVKADLPVGQWVDIIIHSIDGQQVANISKWMNAKQNIETFSTAAWGKGVYTVTMKTSSFATTQKLILTY
jgi:alpha-L-arabinofuranosidase